MHLETVSNGLGAQSMWLLVMACRREIPATVSITADTGWEFDRVWSNGHRSTAKEYFETVVVPLCQKYGIIARFVRSTEKRGEMKPLLQHLEERAAQGRPPAIPMFGSRGGRLPQRCTDKWKIRACRQEARRMGATSNRDAKGIHFGEADRRVKGRFIEMDGQWSVYRTSYKRNGAEVEVKWLTHYYPLVDLKLRREDVAKLITAEGIPFLITSECDGCPHKDLPRWLRQTPDTLQRIADVEAKFNGEYFFTDRRKPLIEAIADMQRDLTQNPDMFAREADFGCGNAECGV